MHENISKYSRESSTNPSLKLAVLSMLALHKLEEKLLGSNIETIWLKLFGEKYPKFQKLKSIVRKKRTCNKPYIKKKPSKRFLKLSRHLKKTPMSL